MFGVPNYATYEHRMALLRGKNSQDVMHDKYIYYAHHREQVMQDCVELWQKYGGRVIDKTWTDHDAPISLLRKCWNLIRFLKHFEFHKIAHKLIPSTRFYIVLNIEREPGVKLADLKSEPPLSKTTEYSTGEIMPPIFDGWFLTFVN